MKGPKPEVGMCLKVMRGNVAVSRTAVVSKGGCVNVYWVTYLSGTWRVGLSRDSKTDWTYWHVLLDLAEVVSVRQMIYSTETLGDLWK